MAVRRKRGFFYEKDGKRTHWEECVYYQSRLDKLSESGWYILFIPFVIAFILLLPFTFPIFVAEWVRNGARKWKEFLKDWKDLTRGLGG